MSALKQVCKSVVRDAVHRIVTNLLTCPPGLIEHIIGTTWPDPASVSFAVLSEIEALQQEGERNAGS
jgi:hypothetical protein